MHRRATLLVSLLVLLAAAAPHAGESRDDVLARTRSLFEQQRYTDAADLITSYLKTHPDDATMHYNLACAHSRLSDTDRAAEHLLRAVKLGFRDFTTMADDDDLANLRDHDVFIAILQAAERAHHAPDTAKSPSAVDLWRSSFGDAHYTYDRDPEHLLTYATALDAQSHAAVRTMLARQADQLIATLFPAQQLARYDVLIAVPTPAHAQQLLQKDNVGGAYYHATRRLITRNIGGSLRHEFTHVLHYRHMEHLQQKHPLWIQEGLATLYEDYTLAPDNTITFTPNDRRNIARRRAQRNLLTKWDVLFALEPRQFMRRAGRLYPEVRAIFEYLAARGKLIEWYTTYTDHFATDTSGVRAFEIVFDQPLKDIERGFSGWLAASDPVDTVVSTGDASLGVEVSADGANDGMLVTRTIPGGGAASAQPMRLIRGDVITAIDEHPVRSSTDLAAALARHQPGDTVTVTYRRRGEYATTSLTLTPLKATLPF